MSEIWQANYSVDKKKVLILSPSFAPATVVGAARMTSLSGFLASENYEVTVVSIKTEISDTDSKRRVPDHIRLIAVDGGNHPSYILKNSIDELMSKEKYNVCIASMGPFFTQKFIGIVCKKHSVPLILDYRDAWLFYKPYYRNKSITVKCKMAVSDFLMLGHEFKNVSYASKIISVTDAMTRILANRYKRYSNKMITIYNGYEDVKNGIGCERRFEENEYVIGCIGKFLYYDKFVAVKILEVIDKLRRSGYKVSIVHVGEEYDDASELVRENGMDTDCYRYLGKKNYDDSMELLRNVDAALIVYAFPEGLGTKVFDYIGMNKPIIYAGVKPSELSEFISQFDNVVIGDTRGELEDGMKRFVNERITCLLSKRTERYSRNEQNRKYEKVIRDML